MAVTEGTAISFNHNLLFLIVHLGTPALLRPGSPGCSGLRQRQAVSPAAHLPLQAQHSPFVSDRGLVGVAFSLASSCLPWGVGWWLCLHTLLLAWLTLTYVKRKGLFIFLATWPSLRPVPALSLRAVGPV